jgi:2-dehydro-3-deoxygluconokinase
VQRVDASAVGNDPHAPIGPYFVGPGIAGRRFSYLRAGSAASRMQPADVPAALIAGARYLHVSGICQALSASAIDAVLLAIELARRAGVRVAYDHNVRLKLWPLARARVTLSATTALVDYSWPASTT